MIYSTFGATVTATFHTQEWEEAISKYHPLRDHLLLLKTNEWIASFSKVERILGFRLPPSAREFPAWWANQDPSLSQFQGWHDAGWETSALDLLKERVTFRRSAIAVAALRGSARISDASTLHSSVSPLSTPFVLISNSWDHVDIHIQFSWQPVGQVEVDQQRRLVFPAVSNRAGLYRFRVLSADREACYIGETEDMSRRFAHYRNPGSSQETNLRINARFLGAIENGSKIGVAIVTEGLIANETGRFVAADLTRKSTRRFLENGALVAGAALDIEVLNRGETGP